MFDQTMQEEEASDSSAGQEEGHQISMQDTSGSSDTGEVASPGTSVFGGLCPISGSPSMVYSLSRVIFTDDVQHLR